jgi:preprotein translocase subunit SecE
MKHITAFLLVFLSVVFMGTSFAVASGSASSNLGSTPLACISFVLLLLAIFDTLIHKLTN